MLSKEKIVNGLNGIAVDDLLKIVDHPSLMHIMFVKVTGMHLLPYDNYFTYFGLCLPQGTVTVSFKSRDVIKNFGNLTYNDLIEKYPEYLI